MAVVANDVYNENIDTIYVDLVSLYELDDDGDVVQSVHLNNCGESLLFTDSFFGQKTYIPAAFELTMPDSTSVNEQSGSLNIGGVTSSYIAMLQNATGTVWLRDALVKYTEVSSGTYIIDPVDIEVDSISISSANASISVTLKSGGILNFYASKYSYTVTNFPGISG